MVASFRFSPSPFLEYGPHLHDPKWLLELQSSHPDSKLQNGENEANHSHFLLRRLPKEMPCKLLLSSHWPELSCVAVLSCKGRWEM